MAIQIIEILGRSTQGITRPFKCRGEDGQIYFVKGHGAGKRSLIAEYVGGTLARAFGLPVADLAIVEVPQELVKWYGGNDANELGAGLAFGSKAVPHVQEFSISHIPQVNTQVRKDVVVFDWWLHNADRTLSEKGGNPNLLWDALHSRLAVIDHNQAFDVDFNAQLFAQSHIFHADFINVLNDWVECESYCDRLAAAFAEFESACDNVPSEWWMIDDGVPTSLDYNAARSILSRYLTNDFWRVV